MKTIAELKKEYALNNKQLSELTGIPMRSLQQWERGDRKPPEYVIPLVENTLKTHVRMGRDRNFVIPIGPVIEDAKVNSVLLKDFDNLTREDVTLLNRAYYAQMTLEIERKDKGGIYGYTQRKMAYNSNKMEGNRMTEDDTATLFETGIVPDGEYRPKDVEEMRGHFVMFNNAVPILYNPLTETVIKNFHYDLQCGVFEYIANGYAPGEYKSRANMVSNITTSAPCDVARDIRALLSWYKDSNMPPLEKNALFHSKYEQIHPFQDGNGRTGRMILYKECFVNECLPMIIEDEKKKEYRDALNLSQTTGLHDQLYGYLKECQRSFYSVLQEFLYNHRISMLQEPDEEPER